MVSFKAMFNSGSAEVFSLENEDKCSFISINNSDQSYYQSADVRLFNLSDANENHLDINTDVNIYIDDNEEFVGYVNRIQKSIMGKKVLDIQCIGKTYDLWRFVTSSTTSFSNKYTGYIISSLVHDYCYTPGSPPPPHSVTSPDIGSTSGVLINYVEFPNMKAGDCIGRMAQMDGYSFYVDTDAKLQYYESSDDSQFTVVESDILDMSPLESSDDSMRNDVLVIGSVEFESQTLKSESDISDWTYISGAERYIAQAITVPGDLHREYLSALKIHVDRSIGDNMPYYLNVELRKDDNGEPSSAAWPTDTAITSSNTISFNGSNIVSPPEWTSYSHYSYPKTFSITGGQTLWVCFHYDAASTTKWWKVGTKDVGSISDGFSSDPEMEETWDYDGQDYGGIWWDATNDRIALYPRAIGYAVARDFHDDGSRRYRDFPISSSEFPSGMTTDQLYFKISCNILSYVTKEYWMPELYMKSTFNYNLEDEKFRPRLMIGLIEDVHPTYDYDAMFGLEFNLMPDTVNYDIGHARSGSALYSYGFFHGTGADKNFEVQSSTVINSPSSLRVYTNADDYNVYVYHSCSPLINFNYNESGAIDRITYKCRHSNRGGTWTTHGDGYYYSIWGISPTETEQGMLTIGFVHGTDIMYNSRAGWQHTGWSWTANTVYTITVERNDKDTFNLIISPGGTINNAEFGTNDTREVQHLTGMVNIRNLQEDTSSSYSMYFDGLRAWKEGDALYSSNAVRVRPFLATTISDGPATEHAYGDWFPTGSSTYECKLEGNDLKFYIDGTLKQTWDISSYILKGNTQFGQGNEKDWDKVRIQLVDTGCSSSTYKTYSNPSYISGNIPWMKIGSSSGSIAFSVSDDSGQTWTNNYNKELVFGVGWNYDNVQGRKEDAPSISDYGRHFYSVNEPLLNTYVDCNNYADGLLDKYKNGVDKGDITINGITNIDINSKFTISASNLGVNQVYEIAQYSQIIDKNGFTTSLSYGEAPYDIARKVANLEREAY